MSDSPGWSSPGSSPSDPSASPGGGDRDEAGPPADPPPKWSKQQPPASPQGWHAQSAPPPDRPGWEHWDQAAVAKPGVIPLRPLGVGEILDGAISTARAHWRTAFGVSLAVSAVIQLASAVATGIWLGDNSGFAALQDNPAPTDEELAAAFTDTLSAAGVGVLAFVIGTVFATAMLTIVVSRAVLGRPVSIGETWRDARPRLPHLLGLTSLVLLIVLSAFAVPSAAGGLLGGLAGGPVPGMLGILAGFLAAVWLWIRYCLSAPALMLEQQGVVTAMRRSARLVRGSWWRVFGIQLVTTVLVTLIELVIQLPFSLLGPIVGGGGLEGLTEGTAGLSWPHLAVVAVGAVLATTATLPLSAGVTVLLYVDQRIRREALDLELARAAGVPGHEDEDPAGGSAPGS